MYQEIEARALEALGLPSLNALEAVLEEPAWDRLDGIRDWCDHIPAEVADAWEELPRDARLVAFVMAAEAAREVPAD